MNHTCLIKCFGEDGCTNSTVIVFYYYYKSFPSCPLLPIFVFLSKKMSLLSVHDGQRVDNPKDLGVKPSGGESCLDLLKTLECDKNLELAFAISAVRIAHHHHHLSLSFSFLGLLI